MDKEFMQAVTGFVGALALAAWPALVFFVIWSYRAQVASLLDSAKNREFAIEVGGQKLTMKEVNTQQQALIADLQKQVNELREQLKGPAALAEVGAAATVTPSAPSATPAASNAILWVDDNPKNNSYFIQLLQDRGYRVDLAPSTAAAQALLNKNSYRLVLSDLGRTENGVFNGQAGLDLLTALRKDKSNLPYVIYSSSAGATKFADQIQAAGGRVTSSSTTLRGVLDELAPDATD